MRATASEIARRRVQRRDEVDGDRPRGQLALLNIDAGAELTDPRRAIPLCNVPRQEDQSVAADEGHERGDRRRYGGKNDGEGLEALIDRHGVHRARKGRDCWGAATTRRMGAARRMTARRHAR